MTDPFITKSQVPLNGFEQMLHTASFLLFVFKQNRVLTYFAFEGKPPLSRSWFGNSNGDGTISRYKFNFSEAV